MILFKGWNELINISIVAVLVFVLVIIYTRIVGLRSFAKMTSTDFVTTVAIGSMIAAVVIPSKPSVVGGCFGIFMIYLLQLITSKLRLKSSLFTNVIENSPVIIMRHGEIDFHALKKVNMTEADLIGKLREANALDTSKIKAVVFESTGDVSVLHGDQELSNLLLSDID